MVKPPFYAKILLFGEYGIIENSKGLCIPYNNYHGVLKKSNANTHEIVNSQKVLLDFFEYLKTIKNTCLDLKTMQQDLREGMYFDSSIPAGYGIGSSGALIAAVYDRYAIEKIDISQKFDQKKLVLLKKTLAQLEDYFHGSSSGLDPLNSYLSLPLLIHSKDELETIGIPNQNNGRSAIFLIDSNSTGKTAKMVEIFMNKMKYEGFRKIFSEEFATYSDACIGHFLKGHFTHFFTDVKKLSKIVLSHFRPMIPQSFHRIWQEGIESNNYYLKLCGSGGGGYILGFAKNYEKAKHQLKGQKLTLVHRF